MIDKGQRDTYYRKLARALHPDKNQHPQAPCAFNKLRQVFEATACF